MKKFICFLMALFVMCPLSVFAMDVDLNDKKQPVYIDEYNEYVGFLLKKAVTMRLPQGFVTYDAIREIGNFEAFQDESIYGYDYEYWFVDDRNQHLRLCIYHDFELERNNESQIYSGTEKDMRYADISVKCLEKDGVFYHYTNGVLHLVEWEIGSTQFVLNIDNGNSDEKKLLGDYPVDGEETFVSRILDASTSKDAVNELMSFVDRIDITLGIYLIVFVIIAMGTFIVFLIIRHRKRVTAIPTEAKE